jgi:hypothetical protein
LTPRKLPPRHHVRRPHFAFFARDFVAQPSLPAASTGQLTSSPPRGVVAHSRVSSRLFFALRCSAIKRRLPVHVRIHPFVCEQIQRGEIERVLPRL